MQIGQIREFGRSHRFPLTDSERLTLLKHLKKECSNIYQELEMSSPYVDAHRDISDGSDPVSIHSHSFYEFLYCENSVGVEYLVGSQRYKLQKGDIIYISPGVSHMPIIPGDLKEPYRRSIIWISRDFMDNMIRKLGPFYELRPFGFFRTEGTQWDMLGGMFNACIREADGEREGHEAILIGNTMALLSYLLRATSESRIDMKAEPPELVDRIMYYIEENLSGRITLQDTAKKFYVSSSTISSTFKSKLGVSFYHCVTQRRLIASKELISQNVPLELVAEKVGFNDYSVFFRAFKKEYGISPREFRTI